MNIQPFIDALQQLALIPEWIIITLAIVSAGLVMVVRTTVKKWDEYGVALSWGFGLLFGTFVILSAQPSNVWIAIVGILLTAGLISTSASGVYAQVRSLQKKSQNGVDIAPEDLILPMEEGYSRIDVPEQPTTGIQE